MPSAAQQQGPLDHLGLAARSATEQHIDVELHVLKIPEIIELRGSPSGAFLSAVQKIIGVSLPLASPETAKSDGLICFWMGPDRWWLVGEGSELPSAHELRRTLAAFDASVVEIGDAFATISVRGDRAQDILSKGCTIDLHPRTFQADQVVQTNLAKAQVALQKIGKETYRIFVRRSFAEYLWMWLEDASFEYGATVRVD